MDFNFSFSICMISSFYVFTCCYLLIYIRRCSLCLNGYGCQYNFYTWFMPSFGMALCMSNYYITRTKWGHFCWNKWCLTTLFFGWLRGILMIGFVGDKKRIFGWPIWILNNSGISRWQQCVHFGGKGCRMIRVWHCDAGILRGLLFRLIID